MRASSSLTQAQRLAAVECFEQGVADRMTARYLGLPRYPVRRLYQRWRIRGAGALVEKASKTQYSFEFKMDLVQRFSAGQGAVPALAAEAGWSSPKVLERWLLVYRREGPEGLRPKPKGRRPASAVPVDAPSELEQLRAENERLRAQVAFLGKLRALSEPEPQ